MLRGSSFYLLITFLFLIAADLYGLSTEKVDSLYKKSISLINTYPDSAMVLANESMKLSEQINYDFGRAKSYYIKAYISNRQHHPAQALLYYLKGSEILETMRDEPSVRDLIKMSMNSAIILRHYKRFKEAHELIDKGLELVKSHEEYDFVKLELKLLYNRAAIFQDQETHGLAIQLLDSITPRNIEIENTNQVFFCWNLSGILHNDIEDYARARYFFNQIIAHPEATDYQKAMAWHNIGLSFQLDQQYDSAIILYRKALLLKKKILNRSMDERIFNTLSNLMEIYLDKGEHGQAVEVGLEALDYYDNVPLEPEHYEIFEYLSTAYHELAEAKASHFYATRFYEENEKYQKMQNDLMALRDEFQVDEFLKDYYQPQSSEESGTYKFIIVSLILIVLGLAIFQARKRLYVM